MGKVLKLIYICKNEYTEEIQIISISIVRVLSDSVLLSEPGRFFYDMFYVNFLQNIHRRLHSRLNALLNGLTLWAVNFWTASEKTKMFYAFTLSAEAPVFFNLFPGAKSATVVCNSNGFPITNDFHKSFSKKLQPVFYFDALF